MLIRNIFFVCAYAFAILYVANQVLTANPSSMIKLIYASIMIVPCIWLISSYSSEAVGALFPAKSQKSPSSRILDVFSFVGIAIMTVGLLCGIAIALNTMNTLITYSRFFIILSLCIISLAILYDMLRFIGIHVNLSSNPRNPLLLIIKLLFYLPCVFREILHAIQQELFLITNPVMTTLLLEIFLLLWILYYPQLRTTMITHSSQGGVPVVNEPLYLNKLQSIRSLSSVYKLDAPAVAYPSQFSISCWVFMNHHDNNYLAYSKPSTIFRLGNVGNLARNVPGLFFHNLDDGSSMAAGTVGTYTIQYEYDESTPGTDDDLIKVQVPLSRWNHFVFSYSDNNFDLFVDGQLVESRKLSNPSGIELNDYDKFFVGEMNGLSGSLCNMIYFPFALSQRAIETQHHILKDQNPPVTHIEK